MKTIVIIPSYEPEEKLIPLTQQLIAKDLEVVVVDDGSGEKYLPIFNQLTGATVLTHPENKGKGEGLKTAYRYIKETYADEEVAIVTADSDGQHSPETSCVSPLGHLLRKTASYSAFETSTEPTSHFEAVSETKLPWKSSNSQAARKLAIHKPAYVDSLAHI